MNTDAGICEECLDYSDELFMGLCEDCLKKVMGLPPTGIEPLQRRRDFDDDPFSKKGNKR